MTIFLLGSLIARAVYHDSKPLQWVKVSSRKIEHPLLDINTATAKQLEALPGIGPKTSLNIVAYRTAHGPFFRLEELRKVTGITKKNWQKIADFFKEEMRHE